MVTYDGALMAHVGLPAGLNAFSGASWGAGTSTAIEVGFRTALKGGSGFSAVGMGSTLVYPMFGASALGRAQLLHLRPSDIEGLSVGSCLRF